MVRGSKFSFRVYMIEVQDLRDLTFRFKASRSTIKVYT